MMHIHGLCWSSCSPAVCIHWPPAAPTPSAPCLLVLAISVTSLTMERSAYTASVREEHTGTFTSALSVPWLVIEIIAIKTKFKVQSSVLQYLTDNGILAQLIKIQIALHITYSIQYHNAVHYF